MICEPYICLESKIYPIGDIQYLDVREAHTRRPFGRPDIYVNHDNTWQRYADFEREKLRELIGPVKIDIDYSGGYRLVRENEISGPLMATEKTAKIWLSEKLTGYSTKDYKNDTEADRLLMRAEFLKAVCLKEGLSWPGVEEPKRISSGGVDLDWGVYCPPAEKKETTASEETKLGDFCSIIGVSEATPEKGLTVWDYSRDATGADGNGELVLAPRREPFWQRMKFGAPVYRDDAVNTYPSPPASAFIKTLVKSYSLEEWKALMGEKEEVDYLPFLKK